MYHVEEAGMLPAKYIINDAINNPGGETVVSVERDQCEDQINLTRNALKILGVPRFGYRLNRIDIWPRHGLYLNFDPNKTSVNITLVLHKKTIARLNDVWRLLSLQG